MRQISVIAVTALLVSIPVTTSAQNGAKVLDRIEDRIDRRENRYDRQTNNGPLDRLEDRIDRREDRRDRRGLDGPSVIDRWERRSWRRVWRTQAGS